VRLLSVDDAGRLSSRPERYAVNTHDTAAHGMRLDVPSRQSIRFEAG
jgi:hypothetical protein